MSNLSCGTHVAEPSANKDCRKLLNQFCRFLPKLKLPISADAKLPLTIIGSPCGSRVGLPVLLAGCQAGRRKWRP